MWHQSLPEHFYCATRTDWDGVGEGREGDPGDGVGEGREGDPGENSKMKSAADLGQVAAEVGGEGEKAGGVDASDGPYASDGPVLGQQGVDVDGCNAQNLFLSFFYPSVLIQKGKILCLLLLRTGWGTGNQKRNVSKTQRLIWYQVWLCDNGDRVRYIHTLNHCTKARQNRPPSLAVR